MSPLTRMPRVSTAACLVLLASLLGACARESAVPTSNAQPAQPIGPSGRVVDSAGVAIAGVFVTLRSSASGIEMTVYSAADGRFELPRMAPGKYLLTASQARIETASMALQIEATPPAPVTLKVAAASQPMRRAHSASWLAALPDGEMKREFIINCLTCHEISHDRVFKNGVLRDAKAWTDAISMMKALDAYAVIPPDFDTTRYAAWLADSLSAERIRTLEPPRPAAVAPASRAILTEYPLPMANELPHDLVVGPDRRIWITAFWNSEIWALNADSGAVDRYSVSNDPGTIAQVRALEFDRRGRLWMVNGGSSSVVRLDVQTRKFDSFPVGMYAHDMVIDSAGDIWINDYFSDPERMARVAAADGKLTVLPLPSAKLPKSAGKPQPYGLQIDAKDRLWSTQLAANTLVRYDIKTGMSKLYTMPDANSGPRRNAVGLDGRIWIPGFNNGVLYAFDPETERFESFPTGDSAMGAYDVAVDPRTGDVWIAAALRSALLRFDVRKKEFETFPLPTEPAYMRHLAIDPANGDVWSAYSSLPTAVPKVVRLQLR